MAAAGVGDVTRAVVEVEPGSWDRLVEAGLVVRYGQTVRLTRKGERALRMPVSDASLPRLWDYLREGRKLLIIERRAASG